MSKELIAIIDDEKIIEYLLNKNHKDGSSKANFLINKGFEIDYPEKLKSVLLGHFKENEIVKVEETSFGTKYVVEGIAVAPDESKFNLRSIWIKTINQNFLKFVTAYPI